VNDPFCCSQCGHRQPAEGNCAACGSDTVHDLRSARMREMFEDIESRLTERREGRIRVAGVVGGMAVVILCWFIPGWWDARGKVYPGLPLIADQIFFMVVVAFGIIKLLERVLAKKRFPFLAELPPTTAP
jgi:hypothetical protein